MESNLFVSASIPVVLKGTKRTKQPSMKTMERWESEGFCRATDGCKVEPDGICPHGAKSWLLELGMI